MHRRVSHKNIPTKFGHHITSHTTHPNEWNEIKLTLEMFLSVCKNYKHNNIEGIRAVCTVQKHTHIHSYTQKFCIFFMIMTFSSWEVWKERPKWTSKQSASAAQLNKHGKSAIWNSLLYWNKIELEFVLWATITRLFDDDVDVDVGLSSNHRLKMTHIYVLPEGERRKQKQTTCWLHSSENSSGCWSAEKKEP